MPELKRLLQDTAYKRSWMLVTEPVEVPQTEELFLEDEHSIRIRSKGFGHFMLWAPTENMICVEPISFYPYTVDQVSLHEGFMYLEKTRSKVSDRNRTNILRMQTRKEQELQEQIEEQYGYLFEEELLKEIEAVAVKRIVKEGDFLMDIGDPILFMPLIMSGAIKILSEDNGGDELLLVLYRKRRYLCDDLILLSPKREKQDQGSGRIRC